MKREQKKDIFFSILREYVIGALTLNEYSEYISSQHFDEIIDRLLRVEHFDDDTHPIFKIYKYIQQASELYKDNKTPENGTLYYLTDKLYQELYFDLSDEKKDYRSSVEFMPEPDDTEPNII